MTSNVNEVVKAVAQLPHDQLKQFCAWYQKFDSEAWDKQIEKDIKAGKLDALAQAAIADHHASPIHGVVIGELLALAYEETVPLVTHLQLKRSRIVRH